MICSVGHELTDVLYILYIHLCNDKNVTLLYSEKDRPALSSDRAPHINNRICLTEIQIWS
jgi:hypothetical protein